MSVRDRPRDPAAVAVQERSSKERHQRPDFGPTQRCQPLVQRFAQWREGRCVHRRSNCDAQIQANGYRRAPPVTLSVQRSECLSPAAGLRLRAAASRVADRPVVQPQVTLQTVEKLGLHHHASGIGDARTLGARF